MMIYAAKKGKSSIMQLMAYRRGQVPPNGLEVHMGDAEVLRKLGNDAYIDECREQVYVCDPDPSLLEFTSSCLPLNKQQ
eukprot:m.290656 g.290656  ORF g.290656 m.290656 type:complete len:79 (+) comp197138_c0_seq1:45-281(+)